MSQVKIRNYNSQDIDKVIKLQEKYAAKNPVYIIRGEKVFNNHPSFENGKNIFCAFNNREQLLGFAAISPQPVSEDKDPDRSHKIWFDIIVDPGIDKKEVKDLLLEKVKKRAQKIKTKLSEKDSNNPVAATSESSVKTFKTEVTNSRTTELSVCKFLQERDSISYWKEKEFALIEKTLIMLRSLSTPMPDILLPEISGSDQIKICRWDMKSKTEQLQYLKAKNKAYPESEMTLESLRWFLPTLEDGTAVTAFDNNDKVIGSCIIYEYGNNSGILEDVFVIPNWRKRGLGQYLVKEALVYAKENDIIEVELEVDKENKAAVKIYKKMGFDVIKEELEFTREI